MKTSINPERIFVACFFVLLLTVFPVQAQFTSGQNAAQVIGQPDFTSNATPTSETGITSPFGIAIDPVTGKLFVADASRHRVLRYANVDSLASGAPPEAALGQPDLFTISAGTNASKMTQPVGIALDSSGRLWVCDALNNRVLRFDNAGTAASGSAADQVLGQPNFTSGGSATAQTGMHSPAGVCVAADGTVWVTDFLNDRVLRFDDAASQGNGPPASGVLGQPNFTLNTFATTQVGMYGPYGVALDDSGTLYVSEQGNDRVTVFINAALKNDGDPADSVLGQPDFVSVGVAAQRDRFYNPLLIDVFSGTLAIADVQNRRCLLFGNAGSLPDGAPAQTVLGKPFFTTSNPFTATRSNTGGLASAAFDAAGRIYLADDGNNRILRFDPPKLAGNSFQPNVSSKAGKGKASYTIGNAGAFAADFALKLRLRGKARVKVKLNGKNVLAAAKKGKATTGVLPPSGKAKLLVKAKGKGSRHGGRLKTVVIATSTAYPAKSDHGTATVRL